MGLWQSMKNFYTKVQYFAAAANPYAGSGYSTQKIKTSRNMNSKAGKELATNETIFSAVSKLSNSIASLPLKLYKDFEPVQNPGSDLLSFEPNLNQTAFDFKRTLEALRNTTGNAYAIKIYGAGFQVESLHIIDPLKVTPVFEEEKMELWYEVKGDKGVYYVYNTDMLHFKHIHGFGFKGISPIDVLRNTLEFDEQIRTFSTEQMNGAKRSFLLKYTGNVSEEKKKEIVQNFIDFYTDNGGIIFQEQGFEISELNERSFIKSELFEVEQITRSRVASVYNLPAYMLGDTKGGGSGSGAESLQFVKETLLPIVTQYEQEFNRKMLTREQRLQGYYYKFNLKALLRADTATQAEAYFKGVRSGIYSPNEIRAWEELPPVTGGDMPFVSGDLYPIDTPVAERTGKGAPTQALKGGENE
ncbi:phage-related putative head portal protein [Fictibacillus macauensis ZFHKF-1]|uniref:Phage-related putative head portal protein n=1 Tax=Fictibacillus macauensis ZFHKF-1 TaxID=1196324 RepID=I8J2E8_9BACL|nr:phage portal protein [Fictibacillus macauensis]EIT85916.1 phage-related putative head portal protein [Fictibacillus macauensis ZFHKF-1]